MGGDMGINNRSAMSPAPVPAGTPAPPGLAPVMPDGTLGLTPSSTDALAKLPEWKELAQLVEPLLEFNPAAPGAEFAPNKCRQY
ncbi:Non-POU domain-containing octamer-binding protein [Sciurus carolinensis]|uniref:Non-POU domain-containing octamer-binding protein n=1 Tax=Sciurus carolinensis TaxID=30640 RepID=A0AA41MUI9_SCICA|nr:Non-POU domain-containing octamer-binding protein [Sciurus carolinensis]